MYNEFVNSNQQFCLAKRISFTDRCRRGELPRPGGKFDKSSVNFLHLGESRLRVEPAQPGTYYVR